MTAGALLVAFGVIASMFRIPLSTITEITLTGIPIAVGAFYYGPVIGGVIGALIDIVGFFVHPVGAFFPGFTISMAFIGLIYGIFLYKRWWAPEKKQDILHKEKLGLLIRIVIAHLIKTIVVSLGLNCLWLSVFYGMTLEAVFGGTLVKESINFAFEAALIYYVIRGLQRVKMR